MAASAGSVPIVMLGDMFAATDSLLDTNRLDSPEKEAQFLDSCRLGPPGSATLFTHRKAAEAAGNKFKLPQFAENALQAIKGSSSGKKKKGAAGAAADATIPPPWKVQRIPLQVGFKLLQQNPSASRLGVPAEDVQLCVLVTTQKQKLLEQQQQLQAAKPGAPKAEPPKPAPPRNGRIPLYRLPGLTLRVQGPDNALLLLSPAFLSPRELGAAVKLVESGRKEMWRAIQMQKRAWVGEKTEQLAKEIRTIEGWVEHKVQPGEKLEDIAKRYLTTTDRLLKDNAGLGERAEGVAPGTALQVLQDPEGDSRGVITTFTAGLKKLHRSALLKWKESKEQEDETTLKSRGPALLQMPLRYDVKATFLEDTLQTLATLNAASAPENPPKESPLSHLTNGLKTYFSTVFVFAGQELIARNAAHLVQPPTPEPEALPESTASTSGNATEADAPAAVSAPAPPPPRPVLMVNPLLTDEEAMRQVASSGMKGCVVASHMAAIASLPPTAEIFQQQRAVSAFLKQVGVEPQFDLEGLALQCDKEVIEGKKPDWFLAPLSPTSELKSVTRGLVLIGDLGLEEVKGVHGIPLPNVGEGDLSELLGVQVAKSKLNPEVKGPGEGEAGKQGGGKEGAVVVAPAKKLA